MPEDEIVDMLSKRYDAAIINIQKAVRDLVLELIREGILVPRTTDSGGENLSKEDLQDIFIIKEHRFEIPALEKYTDMEELLLLDPIHEVDETGWPNIAPDQSEEVK
jgi:hypothetical protein